ASRVEDLLGLLRKEVREVLARQGFGLGTAGRLFGSVAVLIGDDEVHVPAPAQGAIACEAGDRGEIVGLLPEAMRVEAGDRRVDDARRIEALERLPRRLLDAGRLVFEPRLVRGDFA